VPIVDTTSTLDPDQTAPPDAPDPPPAPSVGDGIAATAAKLAGRNAVTIRQFFQQTGQDLDPRQSNWCAAYVNGLLTANGVPGTTGPGNNVATGFLNWGAPVEGEPMAGDVLVQPKGHPAGSTGGHVGIALGQVADGKGGPYYLMQSGNLGGRVAYTWEPAGSVVARRAPQPPPPPQQAP
jgi:hypothetical protein